jgi:hypothetical protein
LLWNDGWAEGSTKSYIVEDLTQEVVIDGIACDGDVTFGEALTDVRGSQPA